MKRCIRGLCSIVAIASILTSMPVMAAENDVDLAQENLQETDGGNEVIGIRITDITAEMASNYALNRAVDMGHDVAAGIAVKYFDLNGNMLGWMVPYVKDGEPCGYMLLDFTQEDFVSEFSFDDVVLVEDDGIAGLSDGDEAVLVENGLWNYELVSRAGLPSISAEDPGLVGGYIIYATKAEFDDNFYRYYPPDNEIFVEERWLNKFNSDDAVSIDYVLSNWRRYSCACVVALEIVRQEGLDDDKSDEEIYRWFWEEMECCPYDDWDADFDFNWIDVNNHDISNLDAAKTDEERDAIHVFAITYNGYGRILYGTADTSELNSAIKKWYFVKHTNPSVTYNHINVGSQFYDNPVAEAISRNLSVYMGFGVTCANGDTVGHAVNIVGWSKYYNNKYTRPRVTYFMIYDGHNTGIRYINFSHTRWDEGPNMCFYFRNITDM